MHSSSIMPFVHLGLVAAVLVAFVAVVVVKGARSRTATRRQDPDAPEVEGRADD